MSYLKVSTITLATAVALSVVVPVTQVHAVEGTTRKNIEKFATRASDLIKKKEDKFASNSDKLKERFASRAGELEKKLASRGAQLLQNRTERLTKLNDNITRRFTRVTERQENILKRANVRIASISAEGKSVTELNAKSASVSASIAKQKTSIAALKTTLTALVTTKATGGQTIGKAIADVTKQVTATHRALQDLIHAIAKTSPEKK
jgi:hypothetical protein